MSAAADSLRVSRGDGRLAGPPLTLDGTVYEIGSDARRASEPGFILLKGSGVAPTHARLRRRADSPVWHLEVLGSARAILGDRPLERGTQVPMLHARDLWVGNNHLQLVYARVSPLAELGLGELSDLEQSLNFRLLDFEERNRDIALREGADREALLSDQLDTLIDAELDGLGHAALDLYCREALRRLLIQRCLMSGTPGDVPLAYSQLTPDQVRKSRLIRQDFIDQLGLDMSAERTEGDIGKVQEGIAAAYAAIGPRVEELMKRILVRDAIRERVLGLFFRLGPIQFLVDIPNISEIMVCGHERVFVEKGSRMFDTGLGLASEAELWRIARSIGARDDKHLTLANPMLDARLPDGSRANIVLAPTSRPGIALTIRKFAARPFSLEDLQARRMFNEPMRLFLVACVRGRRNLIISGSTGSGKTTLLNALSSVIPGDERIVTIEDTAELQLQNRNLVGLEARRPNAEGEGEISIQDLVRNALRMRPDRIVVGECRGREALDMLQAMNTGHDGSMTTAHANSPADLLLRLETMVLQAGTGMPVAAIRQQIAASIDLIVQVRRTAPLGDVRAGETFQRTVTQIVELGEYDMETGEIPTYPVFEFVEDATPPRFMVSGHIPTFFDSLRQRGLIDVERLFGDEVPA